MDDIRVNQSKTTAGTGGFLPYSISGVLSGAATCFYAFVGFDLVATTGEETENPRRAIPISICLVLLTCCLVYCSVAAVLTLMVPYYTIRVDASLPDAFERVGLPHVKIASKVPDADVALLPSFSRSKLPSALSLVSHRVSSVRCFRCHAFCKSAFIDRAQDHGEPI